MKRLKSSAEDIRDLFTTSITARHIAEAFVSFDADRSAAEVRTFMKKKDFDVIGVRHDGQVSHYAKRSELIGDTLGDAEESFDLEHLLPESASLMETIEALRDSPRVFVVVLGKVGGIVTRGDLQKAPVRMWLFGLVSLVEMQLLRIIREYYPDESWMKLVSDGRLDKARDILAGRKKDNEATDLADCLQFCDKRDIVGKTAALWTSLGFESEDDWEEVLKALEHLRNTLAHSGNIVTRSWHRILELAKSAEGIIVKCENWTLGDAADPPSAN